MALFLFVPFGLSDRGRKYHKVSLQNNKFILNFKGDIATKSTKESGIF